MAFYLISYSLEQTYADIVPERLVPWLAFHGVMALVALFAVTVLVWGEADKSEWRDQRDG